MRTKILLIITLLALVWSCQQIEQPQRHTNDLLNAVLWMQRSAEYKALCTQNYHLAKTMLDMALKDKNWTAALEQTNNFKNLHPAVILDVDETVLDNLPLEAQLIQSDKQYNDSLWNAWCDLREAKPIAGALDFCTYAESRGVTVFYVTNRKDPLKEVTRDNLEKVGFPLDDAIETVLTRSKSSDKGERRSQISGNYRILLLIGDNNGDFASGFTGASETVRDSLVSEYDKYWGTKWIVLPNPVYGDWEGALYNYDYSLSDIQKLEEKYSALNTGN